MKKLTVFCLTAMMITCINVPMANADQVALDTILNGAVSYDKDGGNVVVSGSAFYDTITAGGILGTQLVGGDGIDLEVAGNVGVYGVFTYTDSLNVLGWATSNPDQLMDIVVKANELQIDLNGDDIADLQDHYKLSAVDFDGVDYLAATFTELSGWGYTELADGIWFDLAVGGELPEGQVALSVVIDGFSNDAWDTALGSFDAQLLPGTLGEGVPGVRMDSGIYITAIPEPATLALLSLGALVLRKRK